MHEGPWRLSFCAVLVALCPCVTAQGAPAVPLAYSLNFDGVERNYYVALPESFDPQKTYWPLVVVHGGGGNAEGNPKARALRRVADAEQFSAILILPAFITKDKQVSRFPVLGEGDFLQAVLKDVRSQYKLHKKILLNGYSMGAQFTHRFALAHPELVQACAPFAAGTWTTPDGRLLIEEFGEVKDPEVFLADKENARLVPERLSALFEARTAAIAGQPAAEEAKSVPFLVMCGTLDTRRSIAEQFAESLRATGFQVKTAWPKTPHNSRDKAYAAEFARYPQEAIRFFKAHTALE